MLSSLLQENLCLSFACVLAVVVDEGPHLRLSSQCSLQPTLHGDLLQQERRGTFFLSSSTFDYTSALITSSAFQLSERRKKCNCSELVLSAGFKASGKEGIFCSFGLVILVEGEAILKAACIFLYLFSKYTRDQQEPAFLSSPALLFSPQLLWGARLFPLHPRLD